MRIPLQVPPISSNGRLEGHREDIPPPNGGVAGPLQDLHYIDMPYQAIIDYHPQPLAVSDFYLSASESLFDQ